MCYVQQFVDLVFGEVVIDLLNLLKLLLGDRTLVLILDSLAEVIHLSFITSKLKAWAMDKMNII